MADKKKAAKKAKQKEASAAPADSQYDRALTAAGRVGSVFGKVADKVGVPGAMLVLVLLAVWLLGDDKTQNDFVREALFGDITKTRYLGAFLGILIALSVLGTLLKRKIRLGESAELRRVKMERDFLQEMVLKQGLGAIGANGSESAPKLQAGNGGVTLSLPEAQLSSVARDNKPDLTEEDG